MSFWLVNATKFNFTGEEEGGEGQRGHVDLRASPQVKIGVRSATPSFNCNFGDWHKAMA